MTADIGLCFRPARVGQDVLAIISNVHRITCPGRGAQFPMLENLMRDKAQEQAHCSTLTKKERLQIRLNAGQEGFIEVIKNQKENVGEEWLVRIIRLSDNERLEVRLRLPNPGVAGPGKQIDDKFCKLRFSWWKAQSCMVAILGQVVVQSSSSITIPARAFRALLYGPDRVKKKKWPRNWKSDVEKILTALSNVEFAYNSADSRKVQGFFIGEWRYRPAGPGGHGDGDFDIDVKSGFLECLKPFISADGQGGDCATSTFDFNCRPSPEALRRHPYWMLDSGLPFYCAAAGLSPHALNLCMFIDGNITRNTSASGNEGQKGETSSAVPKQELRLYDRSFCPLLPEGRSFVGALGQFRRSPDSGFKLISSTHGQGLAKKMGLSVTLKDVKPALSCLREVVHEYYSGMVVGRCQGHWLSLDELQMLPATEAGSIPLFIFLPKDYRENRVKQWEKTTGHEAKLSSDDNRNGNGRKRESSRRDISPRVRLNEARKNAGMTQKELAAELGICPATLSKIILGQRHIPRAREAEILTWIEEAESSNLGIGR